MGSIYAYLGGNSKRVHDRHNPTDLPLYHTHTQMDMNGICTIMLLLQNYNTITYLGIQLTQSMGPPSKGFHDELLAINHINIYNGDVNGIYI